MWCLSNFCKRLDQTTKILAVAELENINSAWSNEHLKMGENREKRDHFVTSNGQLFGNSNFYALQHPQIWRNSVGSLHKSVTKVKILLIYMYVFFPNIPWLPHRPYLNKWYIRLNK